MIKITLSISSRILCEQFVHTLRIQHTCIYYIAQILLYTLHAHNHHTINFSILRMVLESLMKP